MRATEIKTALENYFDNVYFGTLEELSSILDSAQYPCACVIPQQKTVEFKKTANCFIEKEGVIIAYLSTMDFQADTESIYDEVKNNELEIYKVMNPYINLITNIQCISEINKFDSNVIFSAFSFDLENEINCL